MTLEEALRDYINNLRVDIENVKPYIGDHERMIGLIRAQECLAEELEDLLNEYE